MAEESVPKPSPLWRDFPPITLLLILIGGFLVNAVDQGLQRADRLCRDWLGIKPDETTLEEQRELAGETSD